MSPDLKPDEESARERGLAFDVVLPERIAEWVRARIAEGVFKSPAEASLVAFQRFIELYEHPEIERLLLNAVRQDAGERRPGVPAEQAFAELDAKIRKLDRPD